MDMPQLTCREGDQATHDRRCFYINRWY